MLIAISVIATLLTVVWLILLGRVTRDDWILAAYVKIYDNRANIKKLRLRDRKNADRSSGYSGVTLHILKTVSGKESIKRVQKLEHEITALQKGDIRSLNPFVLPGYVLQREIVAIGKGSVHKSIMSKCFELYGKKHASNKTKQLLAQMLSYPIIGVACTFMLGGILLGMDILSVGLAIIGLGSILVLVLVYARYDELSDLVRKRRITISKNFPNVVSKLALLVTSGMIMDRAWKETAYSRETELYLEMRKTSKELDNLVSPEAAYTNFINRCNTKESAKLASAIMQNLSKGNAEIGRLLKDIAREAWQERRHTAKRDAEKANSKLMIPTMLLFIAILVMLMVPVAMNFTGI